MLSIIYYVYNTEETSFFMCGNEELRTIEQVLPNNICRSTQRGHRIQERICHPNTEGGVFLAESLTRRDTRHARHGLRRRRRVDQHVLVIAALGGGGEVIADELTETELEKADEEGGY